MNTVIEETAANWIARRYAGLTDSEEAELRSWLALDARHAAVFAELETTWRLLDGARMAGDGVRPDPDTLAPRRRPWVRARWGVGLAAAAALLVGGLLWMQGRTAARNYSAQLATAVGIVEKHSLPDGSVVRLNTDSELQVRYGAEERRIRLLRGEAHFDVMKDTTRPFFVEAGGVAVRAVGTSFNVRLKPEAVEVLVTEGRVRIDDAQRGESLLAPRQPAQPPLLAAGERVVVAAATELPGPAAAPVVTVAPAEIERALAWQDRRLEFVAEPLANIVSEFNRYNRSRLHIDDELLAARRFGGSFRANEPDEFVRLLQSRFDVRVERQGSETILRRAP